MDKIGYRYKCTLPILSIRSIYELNIFSKKKERKTMQRKSVKARMVKSIGWENGVLEVEYLSGLIHQYHDVTEAEYIRACVGAIDKKVRHIGKSHRFTKVSD